MGKLSEYESSLSVKLADRQHVDVLILGAGAVGGVAECGEHRANLQAGRTVDWNA